MKQKKKTLLWKIIPPTDAPPSYIFGTMHISHPSVFQNLDLVKEKINECAVFATEFDLDEGQQQMPPNFGMLPDGQRISQLLPAKKYQKTQKILLKAFGIDLRAFDRLQPIFITTIISEKVLPSNSSESLDNHLYNFAKVQGKELTGIETFMEQFHILGKMGIEYQLKELVKLAKNVSGYRKTLKKMIELYQEGDPIKLYKSAKKGTNDKRKLMLYRRNEIMAERILEIGEKQSLFAAIGAAHLAGGKGVLRLVKKVGWEIKPN